MSRWRGCFSTPIDWPVRLLAGRVPKGAHLSRSLAAAVRRCCFIPASLGGWEDEDAQLTKLRFSHLDHSVYLESVSGSCCDEGMCPITEVVMKSRELKETLRLVTKVLSNSRLEPGQRNQLERAKRELTNIVRSGKLEQDRMFRAAEIIAKVMSEFVAHENA